MLSVRELVHQLYQNNIQRENPNLVNSIEIISTQALAGDVFINELLQNADDAIVKSKTKCLGDVRFLMTENYLVLTHYGKSFDADDVNKISNVADKNNAKLYDMNQTGNKGIGFKALFSMTNYILIESMQDRFRFDSEHDYWRGKTDKYPWALTPILTEKEDIPEELKPYLQGDAVSYAMRISTERRQEIKHSITQFFANPHHILFFRAITGLKFQDIVGKSSFSLQKTQLQTNKISEELQLAKLKIDLQVDKENSSSEWLIYDVKAAITAAIRQEIADKNDVPKKYQVTPSVTLSYAFEIKDGKIIPQTSGSLYVRLPTSVVMEMTSVINADFILDISRLHLQNSVAAKCWNENLLRLIYDKQFIVLNALMSTEYRLSVLKLISHPQVSTLLESLKMTTSVLEQFEKNIRSTPLVKCIEGVTCKPIPDVVVDPCGFVEEFGNVQLRRETCIRDYLEDRPIMLSHKARVLKYDDLVNHFKTPWFKATILKPEANARFMKFLIRLDKGFKDETSRKNFKIKIAELDLVLNTKGTLSSINKSFLPKMQFPENQVPSMFNITHSSLLETDIQKGLLEIGIKNLELIPAILRANDSPAHNLFEFTKALIDMQDQFNDEDWIKIKNLKLINRAGKLQNASLMYYTSRYQPIFDLNSVLPIYDYFLSDLYDALDLEKCKSFFTRLGVQSELSGSNISSIVKAVNDVPASVVPFTQLVFRNYYGSNIRKFTYELLHNLKKLKIFTQTKSLVAADRCYLADTYRPVTPIEKIVQGIDYVSENYLSDDTETQAWQSFFKDLGVDETVRFECIAESNYESLLDRLCKEYAGFLKEANSESGEPYCQPIYRPHTSQHKILNLYTSKFIEHLIKTPLFWRMLSEHWSMVTANNSYYKTRDTRVLVPNSFRFFVDAACRHHLDKVASEVYAPTVFQRLNELGKEVEYIESAAILSDEQCEYLGFKTKLSLTDCYRLLNAMERLPVNKNTLSTLSFIYQCMAEATADEQSVPEGLNLLTMANVFKPAREIVLICDNELNASFSNDQCLKVPKVNLTCDLTQLATLLGVQPIQNEQFTIRVENPRDGNDIIYWLTQNTLCLALMEAEISDALVDRESLIEFLKQWLNTYLKKLDDFKFVWVDKITVHFNETIQQNMTLWSDKDGIRAIENTSGSQYKLQLMQAVANYFSLRIKPEVLWDSMDLPLENLRHRHPVLSDENLQLVTELLNDETLSIYRSNKRKSAETLETDAKKARRTDPIPTQTPVVNSSVNINFSQSRYEGGIEGERYIFSQLKQKYSNKMNTNLKYQGATVTDNATEDTYDFVYGQRRKHLVWLNAKSDAKMPYDLKIMTYQGDSLVKVKYIEVKSSVEGATQFKSYFSRYEMETMTSWKQTKNISYKESYRLFCVFNVRNPEKRGYFVSDDPIQDPRLKRVLMLYDGTEGLVTVQSQNL